MNNRNKLLVVDDEQKYLSLIQPRLTSAGFDVVAISDGTSVIESVRKHDPNLVVLDWDLGSKPMKTGEDISLEITTENPRPVLLISNYAVRRDCLDYNVYARDKGLDIRQIDKLFGADKMIEVIKDRLNNGTWPDNLTDPAIMR